MALKKDNPEYITLKEASQMSGYSPDYLGQLIRKGKLEGRQVYVNVAWMTTREAVQDYLNNSKPGSGAGNFGARFKESFRRTMIAKTSGDQVIKFAERIMYAVITVLIIFCLFLIYAFGANLFRVLNAHAASGVPKVLSYQGRLFDSSGNLLGGAGTQYCFRFSIYDGIATGTRVWPAATASAMTATVTNGVFNIGIGDTAAGGDALTYDFQSTDTIYLSVDVATKIDALCTGPSQVFETLSPRERIVASGYAINAGSVGGFAASQNATGSQIPVLNAGNLTLAGVNPQINATGTNTLTLQGGGGTGAIQFFSAANFLNASGTLTVANVITGRALQSTATSSQFIFQGIGATSSLSWTPTTSSTLTIPNFLTPTDTIALLNFAQTINNKTFNTSTLNSPILNSPTVQSGMTIFQNVATSGLVIFQNATGTALVINDTPTSTQSANTVSITAGSNVSGTALLIANYGTGNAFQVNDSSTFVFMIDGIGKVTAQPANDTSSAFSLKNASGTITLFSADTLNNQIKIGRNGTAGTVPTLFGLDKKSDAGDPTGFDGAMYYSSSTGSFRCFQNGTWYDCVPTSMSWQPAFSAARWGYWAPSSMASIAVSSTGLPAPTVNGTGASSTQAEDFYVQWTSGAVSGNIGGLTQNFSSTQPRYAPRLATRIRTDAATTTRRIWVGLNSATITGSDEAAGATSTVIMAVRFSTTAGDTTWQCGSGDGTTISYTNTGVAVASGTYYDIVIDGTTIGQMKCMIATNGGSYVTTVKSTNIPTSSTMLGITNAATTLAASAVVHRMAYTYLQL